MPRHDAPGTAENHPEGKRSLRITRRFHAPRPLVWRAFTEPGLIRQWLWARDHPMTTCEQDFHIGGALRWGGRMPSGREMLMNARFLEIHPPRKFVHTEL